MPGPPRPAWNCLAGAAVVFEQAFSPATTSGPAHASMMTGLRPAQHGAQHNGAAIVRQVRTIAERLRDAGYRTAGFVSHPLVGPKAGLDRGFDTFVVTDTPPPPRRRPRAIAADLQPAAAWLRNDPNRAFLWVHAQHPHFDYRPPLDLRASLRRRGRAEHQPLDCAFAVKEALERHQPIPEQVVKDIIARYDGEIALVDEGWGWFWMRWPPGADLRTTVIVVADHGETLFDRAEKADFGHG